MKYRDLAATGRTRENGDIVDGKLIFPELTKDEADKLANDLTKATTGKGWSASVMGKKGGAAKSDKKQAASRENGKRGGRPAVKKYGYVVRGKHVIAQIEGMSRDAIKLVFTAEYHDPADLRLLFRPGSSLIYGPSVTLLEA